MQRRASSSEIEKDTVATDMKAHQNCYSSISSAMRNKGAVEGTTVEGRATIGKVRGHDRQGCRVGVETGMQSARIDRFAWSRSLVEWS